ncbi:MAG: MFS transporter small subunit [Rhodanobacteraceae bacterium]
MNTTEHVAPASATADSTPRALIVLVWAIALIPLAWGFISTLVKAVTLFE